MLLRLLVELMNEQLDGMSNDTREIAFAAFNNAIRPWTNSYRSIKHQTFDTVIFNHWYRSMPKKFTDTLVGTNYHSIDWNALVDAKTKRKISAILAHRTMRLS